MFKFQFCFNLFLFFLSTFGIIFNRRSIIITLICIELMLLSLNLNFVVLSVYLDDCYGQMFSMFILTVAAAESSIGLAIIILYYRVRGSISLNQVSVLKG
jgi:NADH:ubiquinone oxidoreductase subunit K